MKMFLLSILPFTLQLFKKLLQLGEESFSRSVLQDYNLFHTKDYEANNFSKSEDIDLSKSKLSGFEIVTSFIF